MIEELDKKELKRTIEKTMSKPLRIFKICLEIKQIKNIFGFIPSLYLFTGSKLCFNINFKWLFVDLQIVIDLNMHKRKNFGGIYITPLFVLYYLDKEYKEKFDFQFSWFNIGIRKFFGERKVYKRSLKSYEYIHI